MTKITFVEADGSDTLVDAVNGDSLMSAAVNNGVEGISAECGGGCACATCHCFIDEAWLAAVGVAVDIEQEMLGFAASPQRQTSRLACQVIVTEAMDGMVVRLPETQ